MQKHSVEKLKQKQLALLQTPLGISGSGYTRYGAAMWLFQNGFLASDVLEAYRICSKLDNENPEHI